MEHQFDAKLAIYVLAPWLLKVSLTGKTHFICGYVVSVDHLW